jgi:hypothetical protein
MDVLVWVIYYKVKDGIMCVRASFICNFFLFKLYI